MIDTYLKYGFAGLAVLFIALGFFVRSNRYPLWTAASCAAVGGLGAHYDSFWVLAIGGLTMVWALVCTSNTVDTAWRVKAGLTVAIGLGAFLCVWPTLEGLSSGKIKCPQYIKDRVEFRLVAGLDLRGGLRLVYTVDVEEAIKDKRDRYFDDIRAELATAYGLRTGDKAATREELNGLNDKLTAPFGRECLLARRLVGGAYAL